MNLVMKTKDTSPLAPRSKTTNRTGLCRHACVWVFVYACTRVRAHACPPAHPPTRLGVRLRVRFWDPARHSVVHFSDQVIAVLLRAQNTMCMFTGAALSRGLLASWWR